MPYKLRKAPKRDLYWVIGPDGKHHSKDPLPKERAEAQMKALYSAMRREEEARVPTAREEKQIEKKMEGGVIPPLVRKYRRVLEFVTQRMEDGDVDPEVMFQVYNAVPRDQHGRAVNVTQEHLDEIRAYLHPILSENHMSDLEGILNDANGGGMSGGKQIPPHYWSDTLDAMKDEIENLFNELVLDGRIANEALVFENGTPPTAVSYTHLTLPTIYSV